MDFSSVPRALRSLSRRTPLLPPAVLDLSSLLLSLYESNVMTKEYQDGILRMIAFGGEDGIQTDDGAKIRWEPLAVGLNLGVDYLERSTACLVGDVKGGVYVEGPRVPSLTTTESPKSEPTGDTNATSVDVDMVAFCADFLKVCRAHLEHDEPRVRTLVAKAVGAHARYSCTLPPASSSPPSAELKSQRQGMYQSILKSLHHQMELGRDTENKSKSSEGALDDTTGWRALETNLQGIASYVDGCGGAYMIEEAAEFDKETMERGLLQALEHCCVVHVNRHVRAAGIACLEQIVKSSVAAKETKLLTDPESSLRRTVVEVLKVTLADNWSQVRMAASVLCRTFVTSLISSVQGEPNGEAITSLYPILLPRMCLNRFYLAQGVKLYSHETWRLVFEHGNGLESVAKNAGAVCRYYVKMCDADNHVVREAGCQAVAELAQKLGTNEEYAEYLAPYVPMLLQALLMCFHDESWPVRDEACLACGTFCLAYPEECAPELPTLFSRWTEHLTDQIWSVREDAAVALGDAIVAFGRDMLSKVLTVLEKSLPSAREQPAMTREEYAKRQNDIDSHTNSQLYSCGSLAPKLRKGGAGRIGCSDCQITRPKAPWEATDGCIYLLRELCVRCCSGAESEISLSDETLLPLMTELADVCRVRHFPQGDDLRTTLWRQLPVMAKALGKQRFKRRYLSLFLDLLMSNLDDRAGASQLSVHAAGQCAEELASLVGVGIFRGRLEDDWQQEAFDRVMKNREKMSGGPGIGHGTSAPSDGFSPFGPPEAFSASAGGGDAVGRPFPPPPPSPAVPGTRFTDVL